LFNELFGFLSGVLFKTNPSQRPGSRLVHAVNKSHFFPGFTNWRLDASEKSMLGKRPWRPWRQTMERHNWKLAKREFSPRLGVVFVC